MTSFSLYIANIPKVKTRDELLREFSRLTCGLKDVKIYKRPDDKKNNRGFCFLHFDTYENACLAREQLGLPEFKLWDCDIHVEFANPLYEPDQSVMEQVRILFIRNLTSQVTEDRLRELFCEHGIIEHVKRIKDFAFVHFQFRMEAEEAMHKLQNEEFYGTKLEIEWAKPPSDRQKQNESFDTRQHGMNEMQFGDGGDDDYYFQNPRFDGQNDFPNPPYGEMIGHGNGPEGGPSGYQNFHNIQSLQHYGSEFNGNTNHHHEQGFYGTEIPALPPTGPVELHQRLSCSCPSCGSLLSIIPVARPIQPSQFPMLMETSHMSSGMIGNDEDLSAASRQPITNGLPDRPFKLVGSWRKREYID